MKALTDLYGGQLVTTKDVEPLESVEMRTITMTNENSKVFHNGDVDGDVQIAVPMKRVEVNVDEFNGAPTGVTISVPFNDIRNLILDYLRNREVTKIRSYGYDELAEYFTGDYDQKGV